MKSRLWTTLWRHGHGDGTGEAPNLTGVNMEFIGIFFPVALEEEIALRWARRLGALLGARALELRPETTLTEMLGWAAERRAGGFDFTLVFEPELRRHLKAFLADSDAFTFRDMVRWVANWYQTRAYEHR
jgi:hypothetical protein